MEAFEVLGVFYGVVLGHFFLREITHFINQISLRTSQLFKHRVVYQRLVDFVNFLGTVLIRRVFCRSSTAGSGRLCADHVTEEVIVIFLIPRGHVHVQMLQRLEYFSMEMLLVHLPHHLPCQLGQM